VARFGKEISLHELRHFTGWYFYVALGLPARVAAVQLGHSSPRLIENLYGHGEVGALGEIDRAVSGNVVPLRSVDTKTGTT
jgi:integrase